jgi:hypothetical protein
VRIRVAALLFLLLILPACSAQTADPVAGAAEKRQDPLRAELATMVVPIGDIGGMPRDLRVAPDSGWTDNASEAEGSLDPTDSPASLKAEGRLDGYGLTYYDPTDAALRSGSGILFVSTWVELFGDDDHASGYLKMHFTSAKSLAHSSPRPGVMFEAVTGFAADVGDEAHGLRETGVFGNERIHRTLITFRRGRVIGGAMIARADRGDAAPDAYRIAGILAARVQNAITGKIDEEPVLVPKDGVPLDGQQPTSQKPGDAPNLALVALSASDLPQGVAGEPGQYTRTASPRIMFVRRLLPQGVPIGHTRVVQLTSTVSVFESDEAARASESLTLADRLSKDAPRRFAANFAATSGLHATHVRIKRVQVGDAVGVLTTFDTEAGSIVDLIVSTQRGRGTTSLEAFCARDRFDQDDLLPLLETVAARLDAALS